MEQAKLGKQRLMILFSYESISFTGLLYWFCRFMFLKR